jgi:hypothetical protein
MEERKNESKQKKKNQRKEEAWNDRTKEMKREIGIKLIQSCV